MKGLLARMVLGGASSAAGAPIWLWLLGGLLVAMGGLETARRIQTSSLRADVATAQAATNKAERDHALDRAEWERQASEDMAQKGRETARRMDVQNENQQRTDKLIADLKAARTRADERADRLQLRVSNFAAAAQEADARRADPAAGGQCPATTAALGVLADLRRRVDQVAGELGDFADRSRIAGLKCEADYDTLTLKATPPP